MNYQELMTGFQKEGDSVMMMVWKVERLLESEGWQIKAAPLKARNLVSLFLREVVS